MSSNTAASIVKIETLLAKVVGKQEVRFVSKQDFLKHATSELAKAQQESPAAAHVRLSCLYKSVLYTSAIIENEDADDIKVPIYIAEQTSIGEQSNSVTTPQRLVAGTETDGTVFANGAIAKRLEELATEIAKADVGIAPDAGEAVEKGAWSTAAINALPDNAFLYVEDGSRDDAGKTTPRSLRHFPFKDAAGNIDLPHLRNAIARIPQSSIPAALKPKLQERAQGMLARAEKQAIRKNDSWPGDMNAGARAEANARRAKDHQAKGFREIADPTDDLSFGDDGV